MTIGDNSRGVETRVAILEDAVNRMEKRLETVSERTHTLVNAVNTSTILQEEAQEQRAHISTTLDTVKDNLHTMKNENMKTIIELTHHVRSCETRSGRLEKIGMAMLASLLTLIIMLIVNHLTK